MISQNLQLLSILVLIVFICSITLHIARRNSTTVLIYIMQSVSVSLMILLLGIHGDFLSPGLISIAVLTFLIKCVGAPIFFSKLISRKQLSTSTTTYLNLPITLAIILGLTVLVKSGIFAPIVFLSPLTSQLTIFALSGIMISLFLIVNKRTVFSQLIGILSFENGMVAFTILTGIEQTLAIEIGILFDLTLWIVISSILVRMIYTHFGSLNTNTINKLRE